MAEKILRRRTMHFDALRCDGQNANDINETTHKETPSETRFVADRNGKDRDRDRDLNRRKGSPSESPKEGSARRGTRLAADWMPPAKEWERSYRELGGAQRAERELEKFRNHWIAKPGKDGLKLDWDATWRNWVLKADEFLPSKPPSSRRAFGARDRSGRRVPRGPDPQPAGHRPNVRPARGLAVSLA